MKTKLSWWKKLVDCFNPYQSFFDWIAGSWKCPRCKHRWYNGLAFNDCMIKRRKYGKIVEAELMCPYCNFHQVIKCGEKEC